MISIIAAVAPNNIIGKKNDLPWYLPEDLKRFKELTTGHTVIMGRKTYESIIARLGKPLPNRKNIVITRNPNLVVADGVVSASSLDEALSKKTDDEIFIIGGEQIFNQAIEKADTLYITEVKKAYEGDTYFPEIKGGVWTKNITFNAPEYAFVTYTRVL